LEEAIRSRLNLIGDPCSVANGVPMGIDEMGLVDSVDVDRGGNAIIHLRLTSPTCHMIGYFDVEARRLALEVAGVRSVQVHSDMGLDWTPDMMSDDAKRRRRVALRARGIPIP
jgi:metal-sulfur cluster biosynthetic enzyme